MQALSIKSLKKIYPNQVAALKGIDLEVAQGDFFALLGPNGAGKTTTIGVLCSLVMKSSGKVLVFGHDIDTEPLAAKACIGVVPQEMNFNPFEKVLQVVVHQAGYYGIPAKVAKERAEYYLKKIGIWDKHNEPIFNLSGGMKRRLMIVRALINDPKLLILDEPTAGIDIELRRTLWDFLIELNKNGTTIILTTHYLEEAEQLCKNLAIIDKGRIIQNTEVKSLLSQLHIQTLILNLKAPQPSSLDLINYKTKLLDEVTLEVEIQPHQSLNDLFSTLGQLGIVVKSFRNKTNRLEELFIQLIAENKNK